MEYKSSWINLFGEVCYASSHPHVLSVSDWQQVDFYITEDGSRVDVYMGRGPHGIITKRDVLYRNGQRQVSYTNN